MNTYLLSNNLILFPHSNKHCVTLSAYKKDIFMKLNKQKQPSMFHKKHQCFTPLKILRQYLAQVLQ